MKNFLKHLGIILILPAFIYFTAIFFVASFNPYVWNLWLKSLLYGSLLINIYISLDYYNGNKDDYLDVYDY